PRRLRHRPAPARAERLAVRPRRVPPPHARLVGARRLDLPGAPGAAAAFGRRRGGGRGDVPRDRAPALLRPRRPADPRPSLVRRRSAAPVKRLVLVALAALAFPASAFAHASLLHESPSLEQRVAVAPTRIVLQFDQPVDAVPNAIAVLDSTGKNLA